MDQVGQVFTRTGLVLLALTMVPFVVVSLIVYADGPGDVPWVFIGGVLGVCGFHHLRSGLRKRVLEGTADPSNWLSAGGPEIRRRLLHAYDPVPTLLLTTPYFLVTLAYGLWNWPWIPVLDWQRIFGAMLMSAMTAGSMANGIQWMYFGWLAGHIH